MGAVDDSLAGLESQSQYITRRLCQILLDSQILLRCPDAAVAQRQLDLVQRRAALVRQFGKRPPEIVGSHH